MLQKILIAVFLAATLVFTACSRDNDFNAFMSDFDKLTDDIVKKVNDNPTSAGIDEAQKILDSKKVEMKKKIDDLKTARGFQVSGDTIKKFEKNMLDNGNKIVGLMTKNMGAAVKDPQFMDKMKRLTNEYTSMLQ